MELKDTIQLMCSEDYKERFVAEFVQLKIRYEKLVAMCNKWDDGELNFTPTCPRDFYELQRNAMRDYLACLAIRLIAEHVELPNK